MRDAVPQVPDKLQVGAPVEVPLGGQSVAERYEGATQPQSLKRLGESPRCALPKVVAEGVPDRGAVLPQDGRDRNDRRARVLGLETLDCRRACRVGQQDAHAGVRHVAAVQRLSKLADLERAHPPEANAGYPSRGSDYWRRGASR